MKGGTEAAAGLPPWSVEISILWALETELCPGLGVKRVFVVVVIFL